MVGGRIVVTADGQDVDTRMSGFTVSPHEECAVEEAVRITERYGGTVTVLTLGPAEAAEQLRDMLALGRAPRPCCWRPTAGSGARSPPRPRSRPAAAAARPPTGPAYDLLLFGNEAADTGDYQVGVRVAHALGLAVRHRDQAPGDRTADRCCGRGAGVPGQRRRCSRSPLPAVISVKEGINLPRYPSLPGRLRAKRAVIERVPAASGSPRACARTGCGCRRPSSDAGHRAGHRGGRGARPGPRPGRAGGAVS